MGKLHHHCIQSKSLITFRLQALESVARALPSPPLSQKIKYVLEQSKLLLAYGSLSLLLVLLQNLMVFFRFDSPITATTLEPGIHDPQLRSWLYTPIQNLDDLHSWASEMLTVLDNPVDPSQFVQSMNAARLPYILPDGRSQYLRLYLIRPKGTINSFGLFFHGTHAFMDAHPTLVALALVLDYITAPNLPDIATLPWGTEWKNLPAGPMVSTGGRRVEWDNEGNALLAKVIGAFSNPTIRRQPYYSLWTL